MTVKFPIHLFPFSTPLVNICLQLALQWLLWAAETLSLSSDYLHWRMYNCLQAIVSSLIDNGRGVSEPCSARSNLSEVLVLHSFMAATLRQSRGGARA